MNKPQTMIGVVKSYIARGWNPVPVRFKGKKPIQGEDWQEIIITEANVASYFDGKNLNIGVQLGAHSNGLTDVDLDCPEALVVAPYLMPITKAIFGRKSARASHMLYRTNLAVRVDKGSVPFWDPEKKTPDGKKVMLLEVRCGGAGQAAQTVFPGSVHETGEPIEWEHGYDDDPPEIDGEALLRAARETATACLIARAWPNIGVRHDTALGLGGFLARCGMPTDRIVLFAEAVAAAVGTDSDGRADTKRSAKDAAESYAKGKRAYGLRHLKEMLSSDKVAEKCAEWLGYDGISETATISQQATSPVDLWANFDPPPLPLNLLPATIEQFVLKQGAVMGVDPAGLAIGALVACAAAIPDHVKLKPKRHDSWTEPPRIWAALVSPPGGKKTPTISQVVRPISRIDGRMCRANAEAMKSYHALPSDERKVTPPPPQPRLRLDDTTVEAAQEALKDSPNGLLCIQDELGGWFGSMDRYSGNSHAAMRDRGFWLRTWNGGDYPVNRIKRGSFVIPNLSVCVLGGIQPDMARKVAAEMVDDGLLQRLFLVVLRPATEGRDEPMAGEVNRYEELVERLHERFPVGQVLTLDDGALTVRAQLEKRYLDLAQCTVISKKLAAHLEKYHGLFARLCVLWHCIEHVEQPLDLFPDDREVPAPRPLPHLVTEQTARRVADFMGKFLLPHALAFYAGVLGLSDDHDRLQAIAGYILAKRLEQVTNRHVQRSARSMRKLTRRDIDPLLEQLDALGWVSRVAAGPRFSDVRWIVNPECHRLYEQRAKREAERRRQDHETIVGLLGSGQIFDEE